MLTDVGTLQGGQFIKDVPSSYAPSQIIQWLSRIGFPTSYSEDEISHGMFPRTLEQLEVLARLHLIAFPFENTAMHYTADHAMDVSLQGAFQRLVVDGKGSYCFGQNGLFMDMLRGLGYRAFAGAARVNTTPDDFLNPKFTSLSHMVIFVQPFKDSNRTYLTDVGFGSTGLVRPILLSDADDNTVMGTTPTERHRLARGTHPLTSLDIVGAPSSRADFVWNLEVCHFQSNDRDPAWRLLYSFAENECFPTDAQNASFVASNKPEGIFWHNVLCIKYMLLDELSHCDDELARTQAEEVRAQHPEGVASTYMYKYVMIGGKVTRNIGSSSVTIRTLRDDMERIRALREVFELDIPDNARMHIQGRAASLDGYDGH